MMDEPWTRIYEPEGIVSYQYSNDLTSARPYFSRTQYTLVMSVVRLRDRESLSTIAALTNSEMQVVPYHRSELYNVLPELDAPHHDFDRCLVNANGRTVLVEGVSRGWVTVVRSGIESDVYCHNSLRTATTYLEFVASANRVPFEMEDVYAHFHFVVTPEINEGLPEMEGVDE